MKPCQKITAHIARLEGQLRTLKEQLNTEGSCENIVPLALSAVKSFDSLKSSMVEHFVKNQLVCEREIAPEKLKKFEELLKLIKA